MNAINDAQDSIKIISPYFTLSHKLKKALKNAVKRGVKVEIMLSTKSDIPLTPDCGFYNAHKLMKADYEENAVIVDSCTTQQLVQLFDGEKKDSFLLNEKNWREWRTGWQRFKGWFAAKVLTPFL